MSEESAYALLFPGRGDAGPVHAGPDWARAHREIVRTGVTLKLRTRSTRTGAPRRSGPSPGAGRGGPDPNRASAHSGARVGQEEVAGYVEAGGDRRAEGKGGGLEEEGAEDG